MIFRVYEFIKSLGVFYFYFLKKKNKYIIYNRSTQINLIYILNVVLEIYLKDMLELQLFLEQFLFWIIILKYYKFKKTLNKNNHNNKKLLINKQLNNNIILKFLLTWLVSKKLKKIILIINNQIIKFQSQKKLKILTLTTFWNVRIFSSKINF